MTDEHWVATEPSPRHVRAFFNGVAVADSKRALLLRERDHVGVYYFPMDDVRMELLTRTDKHTRCPYKGDATYWSIDVDGRRAENAVWGYEEPLPDRADIKGHVAFYWDKLDQWFEEDEEVFVHPRDPHHRVDACHSRRHVRVVIGGEAVAETDRPVLVFETGLPVRYYIPKQDVRLDLLRATETVTGCPYKGEARYWSVGEVRDAAWSYPYPLPAVSGIAAHVCFFQERVDEVWVDGEQLDRPHTHWSTKR
ncbi:MAG: DUF427 domain-containing protein [Acidimicrobiia bacterium]|nr:DUF427 domain-containing protein [Acidimicrobiia bacterium]